MTTAAFTAAYADFRLIKTRGVVSISFELPVEQAQAALDVLGGMPVAAAEVWCAIARLNNGKEVMPPDDKHSRLPTPETTPRQNERASAGAKRAWVDLSLPQQAGMLCADIKFQKYLKEKYGSALDPTDGDAADWVRWYCGVKSRSEIRTGTHAADKWHKLESEYRTWLYHPEMA